VYSLHLRLKIQLSSWICAIQSTQLKVVEPAAVVDCSADEVEGDSVGRPANDESAAYHQ